MDKSQSSQVINYEVQPKWETEEPKPTLKCQNIDSKNLEKKIGEIRKRNIENFYTEEELLSWRDHVIRKSKNVNNFIKTSGATENSAIYQG